MPPPASPPYELLTNAPDCIVGVGATSHINGTLTECTTITVEGTLHVHNESYIRTNRILVASGGSFVIGTESDPVDNVTIYLHHDDCDHLVDQNRLQWFTDATADACLQNGEIEILGSWESHGVPVTAWTLLTADCASCSTIQVEECRGWKEGDTIVIAPNFGWGTGKDRAYAPTRTIASVTTNADSCSIGLNASLETTHFGPSLSIANASGSLITMPAEVMHFDRSILITGPTHARTRYTACTSCDASQGVYGFQGITTMARAGASVSMKWHQMTNCGRVLLGAYCHHLHLQGTSGGTFVGIATMYSVNKVWSIHGTSGSVIQDSVVFHHRGAIVYYEVRLCLLNPNSNLTIIPKPRFVFEHGL